MKSIALNNGICMPSLGFGVFRIESEACEGLVLEALNAGYRFIDTAAAYGNEQAVGRAIRRSGIAREELFISTKLWITDTNAARAKAGFKRSMELLGLDYIDLYLIHQPYHDYYAAWDVLESLYVQKKIRALGVDNFSSERLADFLWFQKCWPQVNLVESNILYQREADRAYMAQKRIQMAAWSPLARGGEVLQHPLLLHLAKKYGKTPAQVVLRWLNQRGIPSLCNTSNPKRMRENLNIFDFQLSDQDMSEISKLDTGHSCFPTRDSAMDVEAFLKNAETLAK